MRASLRSGWTSGRSSTIILTQVYFLLTARLACVLCPSAEFFCCGAVWLGIGSLWHTPELLVANVWLFVRSVDDIRNSERSMIINK